MKKTFFYLPAVLLVCTFIFQSCNDDDGYSLGNYVIRMATVERDTQGGAPYFVWDNYEAVWPAATSVSYTGLPTGQRIVGNFTLLSDEEGKFAHYVKLNNYRTVLTKGIINLTEANTDSIGNDPVYISEIWLGSDYLNIEFWMRYPTTRKHMVNLVRNTIDEPNESDGYLHLEYRYNDMGDNTGNYSVYSIVSFKLNAFEAGQGSYPEGVIVKINDATDGIREVRLPHSVTSTNVTKNIAEEFNSDDIE